MPISATGRSNSAMTSAGALHRLRPARAAGFSLMEILVVVFIIALASTAVVMSLPEPTPNADKKARSLATDLTRASREAIMSGVPIALFVETDGYTFQSYRTGSWSPIGRTTRLNTADTSQRERMSLSVKTAEQNERRGIRTEQRDSDAPPEPDVIFYPVGEATAVEITLEQDGKQSIILISEDAEVRIAGQVTP